MRRLVLGVLACLLAVPAAATTFPPSTTEDLVRAAGCVCCAVCESVEARQDPRTGLVFTHARLRLLEELKGRADASIVLRVVGGRAGDVETRVEGMPAFVPGGECVLLLGPANRDGYPVVVQAGRGVLHLDRDDTGGRRLRTPVTGFEELREARVGLDAFRTAVKRCVEEERVAAEKARGGAGAGR
jgi:hypothetical protein